MLIKFTNASKLYGIRLKEYHRVMDENETMEVSEERYRELAGDNK